MNTLYLTHPMNGLLMVFLPIVVGFYLVKKFKIGWSLWWAGGLTFVLSQFVHIPFNLLVLNPLLERSSVFATSKLSALLITSISLGLSAGIFEEIARYVTYRWWQKGARTWAQALTFGAGHGGIEAIILGLMVLYTFLQMTTLRNANLLEIVPENYISLVEQKIDAYWSVPWYLSLFGALERTFTIPFHISAAVLVLQTFKKQKLRWLVLAILWHTIVDALSVSVAQLWGVYAAEGILALIAIISIGIILAFREPYQQTKDELPPLKAPMQIEKVIIQEVSKERIERTRYN